MASTPLQDFLHAYLSDIPLGSPIYSDKLAAELQAEFVMRPVRTDKEIVDQTEALALHFMQLFLGRDMKVAEMRNSDNPYARSCWAAASYAQQLLTDTDVENAIASLDPPRYTAERNHCQCHPETCNCSRWAVLAPNGQKVAGFDNQRRAQAAADAYTLLGRHE